MCKDPRGYIPSVSTPWRAGGGQLPVICFEGTEGLCLSPERPDPGQSPVTGGWVSWRWQGRRTLSCCHARSPLQSSRSSALQVHSGLGSVPPEGRLLRPASGLGTAHTTTPGALCLVPSSSPHKGPGRPGLPDAPGHRQAARVGSAFWPLWVSSQRLHKGHRGGCSGPSARFSAPTGHTPLGQPKRPWDTECKHNGPASKRTASKWSRLEGTAGAGETRARDRAGTWRSGQPVATPVEGGKAD